MKIADFESLSSSAESITTIIALVIGAWWTYLIFIRKREKYPRVQTTHSLLVLGELAGRDLVRVSVKLENVGDVLLSLAKGLVRVQIVRPVPSIWQAQVENGATLQRTEEYEFQWPLWDEFPLAWGEAGYRIEPKESDEFHFDLSLDSTVEAIQVYSYFQNVSEKRRELGWNCTTVQSISRKALVENKQHHAEETKQGPPKGPISPPPPPPQGPPKR
jgi:hypothetical protein